MLETQKIIVFIFITILLLYMIRFYFSSSKKWHVKTYTFLLLMLGLIFLEIATFLDMISNFIDFPIILSVIKILFTFSAILYTTGIIFWTKFTDKMMEKLENLSITDPMTGVLNRSGIEKIYSSFISQKHPFYVIICDLDGTKIINDTYGHIEGDKFINYTSKVISDAIASKGYLSRIGGDEFLIILENMDSLQLDMIVNNIKSKVHDEYFNKNAGISLGYSFFPRDGTNLQELIDSADKKMYLDKTIRR